MALLEVRNLGMSFSGLKALRNVSFEIDRGIVFGLIGPNGAGKTTALNCISRLYRQDEGELRFDGRDLTACPIHSLARFGISRTFQNLELLADSSMLTNVMLGCLAQFPSPLRWQLLGMPRVRRREEEACKRAQQVLSDVGLDSGDERPVRSLTYGERKLVELARALASRPKLLLLDEPAAGLNPHETQKLGALMLRLSREQNISVLLIEHDVPLVMRTCARIVVLDHGVQIAEGSPDEIRRNPAVIEAYMGEEY